MKKILNFTEASTYLNVKQSWLRMAIFKKTIPFIKVGRLIRFDLEELNQWLSKNSIN
ncbi:MAG: excisionase family DNA-binding protein [Bacteriovoracaceae bacterium]|nr:excisionase family DNA-binding protein [Bacteriovoracaceae bacterium]